MRPRSSERYRLQVRVFFQGDGGLEGEGVVVDLSRGGCRVECDHQPANGSELRVSLFVPDYSWPMTVERALVRWVKGRSFGLEFLSLQDAQRARLSRFIMRLKEQVGH
ncbi:PilZ domain-containing protein [Candidatus Nitrospira bockiana]